MRGDQLTTGALPSMRIVPATARGKDALTRDFEVGSPHAYANFSSAKVCQ